MTSPSSAGAEVDELRTLVRSAKVKLCWSAPRARTPPLPLDRDVTNLLRTQTMEFGGQRQLGPSRASMGRKDGAAVGQQNGAAMRR